MTLSRAIFAPLTEGHPRSPLKSPSEPLSPFGWVAPGVPNPADELTLATRFILRRATSQTDANNLLNMLGLGGVR